MADSTMNERDEETARAIENACSWLRNALKAMPNDKRSLFTPEDAQRVDTCLRDLQVISGDALCALGCVLDDRPTP